MLFIKDITYLLVILEIAKCNEEELSNNINVLILNEVGKSGVSVLLKIDIRGEFFLSGVLEIKLANDRTSVKDKTQYWSFTLVGPKEEESKDQSTGFYDQKNLF